MTDSPDNSNRWIDGELRRVPLPDGLLARLREVALRGADEELDDQLAAVPLPPGMLARLSAIAQDESLDRRIANVPMPEGVLARLAAIPEDELLDERISAVETPSTLTPALVRTAGRSWSMPLGARSLAGWGVAASVLIAIGGAYLAKIGPFADPSGVIATGESEELFTDEELAESERIASLVFPGAEIVFNDGSPTTPIAQLAVGSLRETPLAESESVFSQVASTTPREDALWRIDFARRLDGVFTGNPAESNVPPLESARGPAARGFVPPLIRGFDRLTLASKGVNPFVDPANAPQLERVSTPLVTSTTTFDQLRERLAQESGVLTAARVRPAPEDFLAAMNYEFPPPPADVKGAKPLALRTAAGPSPFVSGTRLLQIGIQAATIADVKSPEEKPVVAREVDLIVRFDPKGVAGYRLIGHEATLGLPTAPARVSLRSGEVATVLFEIVLRPGGGNSVGTAELEWTDPATGAKQVLTQPISRVQFANSLAESSISLQAAAVAAEAAEVLRGTRAGMAEHSLERTIEVAASVHPRLRKQAEFRRLVELLEAAKAAGLGRRS